MTKNLEHTVEKRNQSCAGTRELLERLRQSEQARVEFFQKMRPELKRLIELRMSQKLASRLDASDVVQETFVRYIESISVYLDSPRKPPGTWLRNLARDALSSLRRFHIETQSRDVRRELDMDSVVDLPQLATTLSSVSGSVQREDLRNYLIGLFSKMSDLDREILVLVHVEGRTLAEAKDELEINYETIRKRYRRALNRLSASIDKSQLEGYLK